MNDLIKINQFNNESLYIFTYLKCRANVTITRVKDKKGTLLRIQSSITPDFEVYGMNEVKKILRAVVADEQYKEHLKNITDSKKADCKKLGISVKKFASAKAKAIQILGSFNTGHSMGCFKKLIVNGYVFSTDNTERYAKSCTWKPTYGHFEIKLTKKEFKEIQCIEGVWTILGKNNQCKWLHSAGNKQKFHVHFINGFLVGNSHGATLHDAIRANTIKTTTLIKSMANDKRFVSAETVHKETGACMVGIQSFCNRAGLNIEYGYNLGYLKTLNDLVANKYLNKL